MVVRSSEFTEAIYTYIGNSILNGGNPLGDNIISSNSCCKITEEHIFNYFIEKCDNFDFYVEEDLPNEFR